MVRSGIGPWLAIASLALGALSACGAPADVGEECTDSVDCVAELSCFVHQGAELSPVCMPDCPLDGDRFCANGAVCTPASGVDRPADLGVCYLGGETAVGADCTDNLECVRGSICVLQGAIQQCARACTTADGSGCEANEVCTGLMEMGTNGFCEPM